MGVVRRFAEPLGRLRTGDGCRGEKASTGRSEFLADSTGMGTVFRDYSRVPHGTPRAVLLLLGCDCRRSTLLPSAGVVESLDA